jgi:hypothetical protein
MVEELCCLATGDNGIRPYIFDMETSYLIEKILQDNKEYLQTDFEKYRNHVYRVYLLCTTLDTNSGNKDRYAIASVFHDLGIWTNKTFDYLEPSISLANDYLSKQNKSEWNAEICLMIDMHHKITHYSGKFENSVEIFRKADWIDVSKGFIKFGVDKVKIRQINQQFPSKGFHWFLVKKAFINFLLHPFNPLPMFKK